MIDNEYNPIEEIREKGYEFILPERREEWNMLCDEYKDANDLKIALLTQIVAILRNLHTGQFKSITEKELSRFSHTEESWTFVVMNVARFHRLGPKYAAHALPSLGISINDDLKEQIKKIYEENNSFKPNPRR